jgi:hypothetical protein
VQWRLATDAMLRTCLTFCFGPTPDGTRKCQRTNDVVQSSSASRWWLHKENLVWHPVLMHGLHSHGNDMNITIKSHWILLNPIKRPIKSPSYPLKCLIKPSLTHHQYPISPSTPP